MSKKSGGTFAQYLFFFSAQFHLALFIYLLFTTTATSRWCLKWQLFCPNPFRPAQNVHFPPACEDEDIFHIDSRSSSLFAVKERTTLNYWQCENVTDVPILLGHCEQKKFYFYKLCKEQCTWMSFITVVWSISKFELAAIQRVKRCKLSTKGQIYRWQVVFWIHRWTEITTFMCWHLDLLNATTSPAPNPTTV